MKEPFLSALPVLKKLINNGYEAYFVGGSVRDWFLERKIGDIDIATSAIPEKVMTIFPNHVPVGVDHGTVMVEEGGEYYEVTTFRIEGEYDDFRHPNEVNFITSIEDDLSRRDFTINAMAMDIDEKIIDPFRGKGDLEKRMIRCVGNASERFNEDPLRMMRAFRFLSQLSFSLDETTQQAVEKNGYLLEEIAIERIKVEFDKLLQGNSVHTALDLMLDTGLYQYLPNLKNKKNQLKKIVSLSLANLKDLKEYWALFIFVLEVEEIDSFLRKWKSPKVHIKDVTTIVKVLMDLERCEWSKELIYHLGLNLSISTVRVKSILEKLDMEKQIKYINTTYETLPIKSRDELAVNGRDLMSWFDKKPGPWLAEILNNIESAVINGKVKNSKTVIRRWVECNQK